jgi:hypothetical protein
MPRKFPVYLSQEQVDQWIPALLAYQHATDVLSHDPTRDQAYRMTGLDDGPVQASITVRFVHPKEYGGDSAA